MKHLMENNFELFTSNYIIVEMATILSQRISKKIAEDFRNDLYKGNTKILVTSIEIEEITCEIFQKSINKNISYVDYTSITFCKKFNIENLVTLDSDLMKLFNIYSDFHLIVVFIINY